MIDLSSCKTYDEVLDKIAQGIVFTGYGDIFPKLTVFSREIIGVEIKLGDVTIKWRKPEK